MIIKSINIYRNSRLDRDTKKWVEHYKTTVQLQDLSETEVEFSLNDEEQKRLLDDISEILPAKLNNFSNDFKQSLKIVNKTGEPK